jgi:hypothetical protein
MTFANQRSCVVGVIAGALAVVPAGSAAAQLPVPAAPVPVSVPAAGGVVPTVVQTAGGLPVVGGVVSGVAGSAGGVITGVQPAVAGTVGAAVGTVLGGVGAPGAPGAPGTPGGGSLPADAMDSLLAAALGGAAAGGVYGGDGTVVIDAVAPTVRVRVLSRLTQIARTGSLRLEISSDEAGIVAVAGSVRPGPGTRGHTRHHSRTLIRWPSTILGFRSPGRLQVTIKLTRTARMTLGRSRDASVGVATVAADVRRNQRSAYKRLALRR